MPSLRAELTGKSIPDFTVTMPEGWVIQKPSDETRAQMMAGIKQKLMEAHRPDLYPQMKSMISKMYRQMSSTETVAFFSPGPDTPPASFYPATMTASVRRGEQGEPLDSAVAHLIRKRGATALGGDKKVVRWETEGIENVNGTRLPTTTVAYLIPVPKTGRREALQLTVVITHDGSDAQEDHDFLEGLKALFDAHVSTFSWVGQ